EDFVVRARLILEQAEPPIGLEHVEAIAAGFRDGGPEATLERAQRILVRAAVHVLVDDAREPCELRIRGALRSNLQEAVSLKELLLVDVAHVFARVRTESVIELDDAKVARRRGIAHERGAALLHANEPDFGQPMHGLPRD